MALTYSSLFIGCGFPWILLGVVFALTPQGRNSRGRIALWALCGWIVTFAGLVAWGALECWYRGGCGG
jgi:hypothetical protein